jgi:hypothetical protein
VGDEAEVGVKPGEVAGRTGTFEGGLEMALRQLPLPETLIDAAQLAFDVGQVLPVAQRGRRFVARERLAVLAEERLHIPNGLAQPGGVRVSQRESRAEVNQRLGVRVQGAGVLPCYPEVVRGFSILAGQLVVASDLGRQSLGLAAPIRAAGERLGHAPVQEPPPRQTRLLVD